MGISLCLKGKPAKAGLASRSIRLMVGVPLAGTLQSVKVGFAVQLIERKPLPVNPFIAETHKLPEAALFEFAIHDVVSVWVLVEAR